MDNYYHKYNLHLDNITADQIRGTPMSQYGRLKYYTVGNADFVNALPQVCKIPPDNILLAEITGAGFLTAHRDHLTICCLNYYFESNNSTTIFYKEKAGATRHSFPGKETANLYSLEQLDKIGSFAAKSEECFLLNVSEIHAVYAPFNGIRRFITWQWVHTPYQTVLENLIPAG